MVFIHRALAHRCPSEITGLVRAALLFNFSHWTGAILWYKEKKMSTHFWVSAFLPISPESLWGSVHSVSFLARLGTFQPC